MFNLSDRINRVQPSATLRVNARAAELKAEGKDIISLAAGEPDFNTPEHVKQAAMEAINNNITRYTATPGTVELRTAIVAKFKRDNNLDYGLDQVIVSCGGKQSFFNLTQVLLQQGDAVIIPAPCWVSFPEIVRLAGATPVIISTTMEQQFKITPEQLEQAITENTKLVLLNSPNNPTGMAYSLEELRALGAVLEQYPAIIIATDDIYEHIIWNGKFVNIAMACPNLVARIVVLNGVSKAYAMTGWRIGYAAGPKDIIKAMTKIQSQSTSGACSIAQAAAVAALNGPQDRIVEMVTAFKQRHDYIVAALNNIPGISCATADGAFYAFANVIGMIARLGLKDDLEFCTYLLEKAGVAVVAGSAFAAPGYIRLSFATDMQTLQDAVARITAATRAQGPAAES